MLPLGQGDAMARGAVDDADSTLAPPQAQGRILGRGPPDRAASAMAIHARQLAVEPHLQIL